MATILAEEMGKLIEVEAIRDAEGLENSLRQMLKEVGAQSYGQVLEREDEQLGKRVGCECGGQAQRISRRGAKVMTVFGWVSYRRSYYGCEVCGGKGHRLDRSGVCNLGK